MSLTSKPFTPDRLAQVCALIERVTFPGYIFQLFFLRDSLLGIRAKFFAPCNLAGGQPIPQLTRMWILEGDATDEQIVQTCLKLVLTSVEHEAREQFRFDGLAIFGPHMRLQDLVMSAQLTLFGREL